MSVTYYTGSGQSAFTVAVTVGLPVWEDAIPEVGGKLVFRQEHMIRAVSFERLTLSTTYTAHGSYGVPTSSSYFLVGEEGFTDERGGMLRWSRVWATVPTAWTDMQDVPFTYPGYVVPISIGTRYLFSAGWTQTATYIILGSITAVITGDLLYLDGAYTRGGVSYRVNQFTTAVGVEGGSVLIRPVLPGTGSYTDGGVWIREAARGRNVPETIVVPGLIQHDYAIGSVTYIDQALPIVDRFTPVDSTGNSVSYLSTGTATAPNSSEYYASIVSNANIVAECIRERWLGNIYVRKIVMVPAR